MLLGRVWWGTSGLAVALASAFNDERCVASVLVRLMKRVDRVIVFDDGSAGIP